MIIHFQLNYLTQWGEHIAVEIDGNANQPVALSTEDGQHCVDINAYAKNVVHSDTSFTPKVK